MKKLIVFTLLLTFGITKAQDKKFKFGAKIGVNLATISNNDNINEKSRIGLEIGGLIELAISEKFSFAPEVIYSQQGEVDEITIPEGKFKSISQLNYINIPIIAKYYITNGFAIEVGPQIGFLTEANQALTADGNFNGNFENLADMYFENNFSKIDFSLDFGFSYRLPINIFIQARYALGVSNINNIENSNDKFRNNVLQFSVGYLF